MFDASYVSQAPFLAEKEKKKNNNNNQFNSMTSDLSIFVYLKIVSTRK